MDAEEHVTEVNVHASRKVQLDNYEPFESRVGLTADVPEGLSSEEFDAFVRSLTDRAEDEAERAAMQRFEAYVREEAFEEDS